jgi:hypothetical protein
MSQTKSKPSFKILVPWRKDFIDPFESVAISTGLNVILITELKICKYSYISYIKYMELTPSF